MGRKATEPELLDYYLHEVLQKPGAAIPEGLDPEIARFAYAVGVIERGAAAEQLATEAQARIWQLTLAAARQSQPNRAARFRQRFAAPLVGSRLKYGLVAALVLLISMGALWPVLGQAVFSHIRPQEVTSAPWFPPRPNGPLPTRRWESLAQLQEQLGLTLLVPGYLPANCTPRERFFISGPKAAYTTFSCIFITEQVAQGHVAMPYIEKGSSKQVTVNGLPAVYIDGTWADGPDQTETTWHSGVGQNVLFERDGLIIEVMNARNLQEKDLLRIASSLRPATARELQTSP